MTTSISPTSSTETKISSSTATTSLISSDVVMKTEEEASKDLAKEKRKSQIKAKAEERRLKMLAQMSEMQKNFIKKNKDFFEETQFEAEKEGVSTIDMEVGYLKILNLMYSIVCNLFLQL